MDARDRFHTHLFDTFPKHLTQNFDVMAALQENSDDHKTGRIHIHECVKAIN